MSKVYERENGRKAQTQPTHSWWIDSTTRDEFDRAVARETLRMRGMTLRQKQDDPAHEHA